MNIPDFLGGFIGIFVLLFLLALAFAWIFIPFILMGIQKDIRRTNQLLEHSNYLQQRNALKQSEEIPRATLSE